MQIQEQNALWAEVAKNGGLEKLGSPTKKDDSTDEYKPKEEPKILAQEVTDSRGMPKDTEQ